MSYLTLQRLTLPSRAFLTKRFRSTHATTNLKWWPSLENPWIEDTLTQSPLPSDPASSSCWVDKYESSSQDFKWVEAILDRGIIPPPPSNLDGPTASGWIAPNPALSKGLPFAVRRSKNHMLPVYLQERSRKMSEQAHGIRQLTVIRHIDGDMWALADQLRELLIGQCERRQFLCQVDEATRQIKIEGLFLTQVANFLLAKGF